MIGWTDGGVTKAGPLNGESELRDPIPLLSLSCSIVSDSL